MNYSNCVSVSQAFFLILYGTSAASMPYSEGWPKNLTGRLMYPCHRVQILPNWSYFSLGMVLVYSNPSFFCIWSSKLDWLARKTQWRLEETLLLMIHENRTWNNQNRTKKVCNCSWKEVNIFTEHCGRVLISNSWRNSCKMRLYDFCTH